MHRFSQDLKKRSTEDGQNGHTQSRLSDHHKLLSHLTVVCTLLHCEKGVRMPSTDTYDASLLHFEDAAFFIFFFASNTRNTRGVTKGVHCGHAPNVHHAKYEYPPDDTIHVLPGGRHTWSTVRRWNASSHLHDAALLGCVS